MAARYFPDQPRIIHIWGERICPFPDMPDTVW